jgi:hypothetical protein
VGVGWEWASSAWLPNFAWGLAVLAACTGWGLATARIAGVTSRVEWPIYACWGMAGLLACGGTLAAAGLLYRAELIALTAIGFVLYLIFSRPQRIDWKALALFGTILVLWYVPAVASTQYEPYDDQLAYFSFVRRLFDTGTLIEPFSLRRLASYGGQSMLHAMTVAFGTEKNMHLLDAGLGTLILAGLVCAVTRKAVPTIVALLIPVPHANTMSQVTGIVCYITLFRTLTLNAPNPVLAGLVAAGMCTLRMSYVPAVAITLLAWSLLNRERWREAATMGGVCAAALMPWAVLSYRSSGSLLYPLFRGFQREGFDFTAGAALADRLHTLAATLTNPSVVLLLAPAVVAAVVARRGTHTAFAMGAIVSAVALASSLPVSDSATIYRYLQPVAFGSMVIAMGVLIEHRRTATVLAVLLAPILVLHAMITVRERAGALASLPATLTDRRPLFAEGDRERYAGITRAIPEGSAMFAILPQPSLLDYRHVRIWNADLVGCASPPPGLPFFEGPARLKSYLRSLGIEYVAYNDFDHPRVQTGYWRTWWRERAPGNRVLAPLRPYFLDLASNVEQLARTEVIAGRWGDLTLIRLRGEATRPSPPSTGGSASAATAQGAHSVSGPGE